MIAKKIHQPESTGRTGSHLRRALLAVLFSLTTLSTAGAEPTLIGVLSDMFGPPPAAVGLDEGLQQLGYQPGQDYVIGSRFTSGDPQKLARAVDQFVNDGASILLTVGFPATQQANIASSLPVIFTTIDDPVRAGLVDSFAKPGGRVTGIASLDRSLDISRLEKFKLLVPGMKKVLAPYGTAVTNVDQDIDNLVKIAALAGIELMPQPLASLTDAKQFFAASLENSFDGIIWFGLNFEPNLPGLILEAANRTLIPTFFPGPDYVEYGGLASYGPSYRDSGRQAARLVDKIIKGIKPADIPVETASFFKFTINLETAKRLGLSIDPEVLYQADRVIQ